MAPTLNTFIPFFLSSLPVFFPRSLFCEKETKGLTPQKKNEIQSKIAQLSSLLKINKTVELFEKQSFFLIAQAQGINLLCGRAAVAINPNKCNDMPDNQIEFILAHELSHIKANDALWLSTILTITVLASDILSPFNFLTYGVPLLLCSIATTILSITVFIVTAAFFSKWIEKRADLSAISICSDKAKAESVSFFQQIKKNHILYRNEQNINHILKAWRRLVITEEGDYRLDIFHPSINTRIAYLNQAIHSTQSS